MFVPIHRGRPTCAIKKRRHSAEVDRFLEHFYTRGALGLQKLGYIGRPRPMEK